MLPTTAGIREQSCGQWNIATVKILSRISWIWISIVENPLQIYSLLFPFLNISIWFCFHFVSTLKQFSTNQIQFKVHFRSITNCFQLPSHFNNHSAGQKCDLLMFFYRVSQKTVQIFNLIFKSLECFLGDTLYLKYILKLQSPGAVLIETDK